MKPNTADRKLAVKLSVLGMSAVLAATAFLAAPRYTAEAAWNTNTYNNILKNTNGNVFLKEPANCTVNLIDYWMSTDQTKPDEYNDETGSNTAGINGGHYLTFDTAQKGAWNAWTNNASGSSSGTYASRSLDGDGKAYRGIVNYNLGDDGYPRLSLGQYAWTGTVKNDFDNRPSEVGTRSGGENESLAYLFNPDNETTAYSQAYRRGYADVKGLFRYGGTGASNADMTGYYWYDSTVNFAEMRAYTSDRSETQFDAGIDYYAADSATLKNASYSFYLYNTALSGSGFAGQFFPLNYVNRGRVSNADRSLFSTSGGFNPSTTTWGEIGQTNYLRSRVNHYFGMSMEVEFMQPADYKVDGKDMTFTFAGDDDVWIFCDDVLIADLGGNHNSLACDINFSTGEIVYYASQSGRAAENDVWRVDYLSNCFGVDLDYGREVKGWHTEEDWIVPDSYNSKTWKSGRSGADLDFSMAATNAKHEGVPETKFGTFEELTRHTLKFFFLEGGNYSNCMLKFNLSAIAE